jgi:hypothetical protein
LSIVERRALTVRVGGLDYDDVLDTARFVERLAKTQALTVYGTRPRYGVLVGKYTANLLIVGGKGGIKALMDMLSRIQGAAPEDVGRVLADIYRTLGITPGIEEPEIAEKMARGLVEVEFRRMVEPALKDWAIVTAEAIAVRPQDFVKEVLHMKKVALSHGLSVRGPRWYPIVVGEPRKATMAVGGPPTGIKGFIEDLGKLYAVAYYSPLSRPREVRGALTGIKVNIRLIRLHPWAEPELQVTYDRTRGVYTYRCPIDGVVLTSVTKDGLYELIAIHVRTHK